MRWILVALLTTVATLAAGQNATLPDGDGKAIVNSACTTCHGADLITGRTGTRDEWAGVVDRMKTYGTVLDTAQTTTVIDYLAKSFAPKGADVPAAAAQNDVDAIGKGLVNGVCASCHAADLTTAKQATRNEWKELVDRMKGYGAVLDEKQTATLLDYLEKNHGPKTAAAGDEGKKVLEGFCASCHDLDIVSARTGTQAEWQEVVDRMNGRGAGVPDKDVVTLVQYLVKTYAPKN